MTQLSTLVVSDQQWSPSDTACRRTRARLQAWMAIRLCSRTGTQLREMVGTSGDIASLTTETVKAKFSNPMEQGAALYNLELVRFINTKRKDRRNEIA